MEDNKIHLQTPVAAFEDRQLKHSLGDRKTLKQRLSEEQFLNIYDYVKNPDEVYTRQGSVGLAFIRLINDEMIIKVCVKLDKTKRKKDVNYISTIGKVPKSELLNAKMYKKIE